MKSLVRTLALMAAAIPALAAAEKFEQTRQGFGISFGLGGGSGAIDCRVCDDDRQGGSSGYLRLGGYVRPDLFVAFEANGYSASSQGVDYEGGFWSVALQWYPNPEKGFYLKGNLGVGAVTAEAGGDELGVGAVGLGLGLGYDFRLGRNFSLTPYVNLLVTGRNGVKLNDQPTGFDASLSLVQLGLGFTWH